MVAALRLTIAFSLVASTLVLLFLGGDSFYDAFAQGITVPSAPSGLVATPGNSYVILSWTAPTNNGGSTITGYVIQHRHGTGNWSADIPGTSSPGAVSEINNGTEYQFRVAAVNSVGRGSWSDVITATPQAVVPWHPIGLSASAGNTKMSLSWSLPMGDGGSPITDYIIQYRLKNTNTWKTFNDGIQTTTSATVTSLTNGSEYIFRVAAVNSVGQGFWSGVITATPQAAVPDAPTNLRASAGNNSVSLYWFAPSDNGGSPITDYTIQYKLKNTNSWTTFNDGRKTTTAAIVISLVNGSAYDFRVAAVNSVGTGSWSSEVAATPRAPPPPPTTEPDAPTNLRASAGNTRVSLYWSAPSDNGGSPITDYTIQYKLKNTNSWTTFNDGRKTTTSATVIGLVNGSAYDFRVAAVNSVGTSNYSSVVASTPVRPFQPLIIIPNTPLTTAPSAPGDLSAKPDNKQVTLSWTAPADNGGAKITDYIVEYRKGTDAFIAFSDDLGISTSATVKKLRNDTLYDFRVAAVNSVGTGTYSDIVSATPFSLDKPSAPRDLSAKPDNKQVTLSWTAPADNGGAKITDYVILFKETSRTFWKTFPDKIEPTTTVQVTGLTNGTSYDFIVAATNSVGDGKLSDKITATPVAPSVPQNISTDVVLRVSVFNDSNNNRIKDANESAASGIALITYVPDTKEVDILVTGTDGTASKTYLKPDTFWVITVPPNGKGATTPSTLLNGVTYTGVLHVKDPSAGSVYNMEVGINSDPCALVPLNSLPAMLLNCKQ